MKVLIVDKLSPGNRNLAGAARHGSGGRQEPHGGDPARRAGGRDILVVRSTKVTAAAIEAAAQLSLIIRAGAGVDTIDLAAASAGESTSPIVRARTRRRWPSWPSGC